MPHTGSFVNFMELFAALAQLAIAQQFPPQGGERGVLKYHPGHEGIPHHPHLVLSALPLRCLNFILFNAAQLARCKYLVG
jgi:hypothetical protein